MEDKKVICRGEAALLCVVLMNSFGVVLMLHSAFGISAISSVPYAFSEVFTRFSLGAWTYIFQSALIMILFVLRRKFVPEYLFSFVVGFVFGILMDVHKAWIAILPQEIGLRILYFCISYLVLCCGIALANRCRLPIIPTDLFPREVSLILKKPYAKVKICFDVTCVLTTGFLTWLFLGHIEGLGIGTVLSALTMGKVIGIIGEQMDRKLTFVSFWNGGNK